MSHLLLAIYCAITSALAGAAGGPSATPAGHRRDVGPRVSRDGSPRAHEPPEKATASVREFRPISLSLSGVGKTPFFGAQADVNLIPYVGFGLGYGYFSIDSVSGSFVPIFLNLYPLETNFTPFVEVGADFVTVRFQSANSFLSSEFKGTQLIVGLGLEYRFDFGLLARVDAVRFINAKLWAPGLAIGYSLVIF